MRTKTLLILIYILLYAALNSGAAASQTTSGNNDIKQLKEQLERLKQEHELKLKELENLINEIKTAIEQKEQDEELQKLLEEASRLQTVEKEEESGIGKKFHTGVRQQSGLNPNISFAGDFFGAVSSEDAAFIRRPSDVSYGNNRFELREVELSLVAPLDPFTRGKSFISITEENICIEEAYMEWLNLPARMNLKVGLFNIEYGILNRYHDHALPQFDRPKVLVNMFSNANMGGFGMAGNFMMPKLFWSDAASLDLSVINGGSGQSFTDQAKHNILFSGNLTTFYDITQNTFFEWRIGGVSGFNDPAEEFRSYVGNLSLNLKWVPVDRSKYRIIDWKTEFLFSRRETPGDPVNSMGFYSSIQNKVNARWWLTGRIDYSELPYSNEQHEWAFTGGADLWQSEFVFIRMQYQYSKREFADYFNYQGPFPKDHTFIIQFNWAMGPHKHEAY
ncbi:hypothetical protein ACFL6G_01100 [candidate division KSB1 bacterium]